jgi:DnaJ-class molecular chaperone
VIYERAAPEAPPAGVPHCSYCKGAGEVRQRLIKVVYRICYLCDGRGWVEPNGSSGADAATDLQGE